MPDIYELINKMNDRALKKKFKKRKKNSPKPANKTIVGKNNRLKNACNYFRNISAFVLFSFYF